MQMFKNRAPRAHTLSVHLFQATDVTWRQVLPLNTDGILEELKLPALLSV